MQITIVCYRPEGQTTQRPFSSVWYQFGLKCPGFLKVNAKNIRLVLTPREGDLDEFEGVPRTRRLEGAFDQI